MVLVIEFLDYFVNLIVFFLFVKVWIVVLGFCVKVIVSVVCCNIVILIYWRLLIIKFRFIECWDYNKYFFEVILELEGLIFFLRD